MDASRQAAHTLDISESTTAGIVESERLARRYFELFAQHAFEKLREIVHPDVVLELQAVQPGHVVRGRDEFIRFVEQEFDRHLWEAVAHVFAPLDENRVIVEGRVRWFDDENVLRDDPRVWALEFSDGLLLLSVPAKNTIEAGSILSARHRAVP
ncbi:MAG: nuclear transport factor 2 family protein [Actinobacteria bacterium]|nr:nuclear transport factor 2 family protein [Actinomycetota bacterium]